MELKEPDVNSSRVSHVNSGFEFDICFSRCQVRRADPRYY
jgi:hypothetical protein